eukprot:3553248-Pyramimonas_sp.AAC.1
MGGETRRRCIFKTWARGSPGEGPNPMQLRVAQALTARRGGDRVHDGADKGLRNKRAEVRWAPYK